MLAFGWLVGTVVLGASAATAALLLWIVSRMAPAPEEPRLQEAREGAERCVMLFDGPRLFDATPPARAMLDAIEGSGDPHARLVRHLQARFGHLGGALEDLEALGRVEFRSGGSRLAARWCDGLTRIEVIEAPASDARSLPAPGARSAAEAHLGAIEEELRMLRAAVEASPWPIWHIGPDGVVDWANPAYVERAAPPGAAGPAGWPPPALFEGRAAEGGRRTGAPGVAGALNALVPAEGSRGERRGARRGGDATGGLRPGTPPRRLRAAPGTRAGTREGKRAPGAGDDPEAWYDCVARPGTAPGAAMHFAAPAEAAVRAERSLEQFVQTLSKTFAHLPVGLAVFDARRGLSLFNPALTDLTALPVEFLSARPTLPEFLDRLRDARRMPEPRDYRSWRERITALEAASAEGTYLETWSLAGGQTWRVSGRPHPDGAIALMFEDISSEIALTRRFRSELEVGQAVVDAMREAIAVFAPDGVLTLANEAYARLWGSDPRTTLGDLGVADASRSWMERSEPAPLWGELRDFVGQIGERAPWTGEARLKDGRRLSCRAVPLAAGATLIGFAVETADGARDGPDDGLRGEADDEATAPAGGAPEEAGTAPTLAPGPEADRGLRPAVGGARAADPAMPGPSGARLARISEAVPTGVRGEAEAGRGPLHRIDALAAGSRRRGRREPIRSPGRAALPHGVPNPCRPGTEDPAAHRTPRPPRPPCAPLAGATGRPARAPRAAAVSGRPSRPCPSPDGRPSSILMSAAPLRSAPATAFERVLDGPDATAALGRRLAPRLRAGDAVLLEGPLGAGKSHLARAVIRARTRPDEEVPSPSYTLVQTYEAADGTALWHADLHRLAGPEEAWELGLADAFAEAVCLVEWPERLGALAPADALWLTLAIEGEGRRLRARADAPRWAGIEALLDG